MRTQPRRRGGNRRTPAAWGLALSLTLGTACCGVARAAAPLAVEWGPEGLTSLGVQGSPLLRDGQLRITAARFTAPDGTVLPAAETTPRQTAVDAAGRRVTLTYDWGSIRALYETASNRLDLTIEIANTTSDATLFSLQLQVLELVFPSPPERLGPQGQMTTTLGAPAIAVADWESGRLVVAGDDVGRPLALGFGPPSSADRRTYPVLVFTGRHPRFPNTFPYVDRPIPPGGTDRTRISLRAGPPKSELTPDLYAAFARAFPYRLEWKDRRPIGMLFASSRGHVSETNPRGWMSRAYNAVADSDQTQFRKGLLDMAQRAVALCQEADAQGVILWDPEGQEWPHPVSYLGDPRSLPPEMDAVADEFFRVFTNAGLRTGVCIRWQRPVRAAYKPEVFQMPLWDRRQRVSELLARMQEARKRWGCTLFYLDSNGVWTDDPVLYLDQPAYGRQLDALTIRRVTENMPDCLVIPEHEDLQTFACSAPYIDLRLEKTPGTPAWVRQAYPQAFSVIAIGESPMSQYHDALVDAVRKGDILMFRAWYRDSTFEPMKKIYGEAGGGSPAGGIRR